MHLTVGESINFWWRFHLGYRFRITFHFPQHCRIGHFRTFITILPRDAMHSADYTVASVRLCVYMSVRPSVCHTAVFCQNGYTYPHTFFLHYCVTIPF